MKKCPNCGGKLMYLYETTIKDYFELERIEKDGKKLDRSIPCDSEENEEEYLECTVCLTKIKR